MTARRAVLGAGRILAGTIIAVTMVAALFVGSIVVGTAALFRGRPAGPS